jgi:hypothetical protein
MKYLLVFTIFLSVTFNPINAQSSSDKFFTIESDSDNEIDTNKYRVKHRGNWQGFDFGVAILNGKQSEYLKPSLSFSYNIFDWKFLFRNSKKLGVTTGLGISTNTFLLSKSTNFNFNNDSVWTSPSSVNYKKNSFGNLYLNIPILLDFNQFKPDSTKGIYFVAGVVSRINLFNDWNTYRKLENGNYSTDLTGRFNMNLINVDATIRAGYKHVGFYATYGLVPMFNQTKTSNLFTAGISLTFK